MIRCIVIVLAFLFTVIGVGAQSVLRFQVSSLPSYHSPHDELYIAGSFNGWNPGDASFRLQQDEYGHYYLQLSLPAGAYEYKITRGGWDRVECAADGRQIGNRQLIVHVDTTLDMQILGWADHFAGQPKKSTASKQVRIMDTAFLMQPMDRSRRIWLYLPAGYETSAKRYPVLYMQDGQNLFDDSSSYAGEWGVDEFLDSTLLEQCIVVGIDNGGVKRMTEYNPYDHDQFGKGEGEDYVDFMAHTLKPYIDSHYRTYPDRKHTCVAGSSMGGLISFYALLKYPSVFGAAGVFSPAFWTASGLASDVKSAGRKFRGRLFFYAGYMESETMVPDMQSLMDQVRKYTRARVVESLDGHGQHNESTWRAHFPDFYQWLMGN